MAFKKNKIINERKIFEWALQLQKYELSKKLEKAWKKNKKNLIYENNASGNIWNTFKYIPHKISCNLLCNNLFTS